jgi:hypothetical protein
VTILRKKFSPPGRRTVGALALEVRALFNSGSATAVNGASGSKSTATIRLMNSCRFIGTP